MELKQIQKKLARRNKWKNIISALVILLAIAGYQLIKINTSQAQLELSRLNLAKIKRGDLEVKILASGTFSAHNIRVITAAQSGQVDNIFSTEGQTLQYNDKIIQLSNHQLIEDESLKKTQLQSALLQHQVKLTELNIKQLRQQQLIEKKRGLLSIAQAKYQAKKALNEKGIISALSLMEAEVELSSVRKELGTENKALNALIDLEEKERQLSQKNVEQAQASLDTVTKSIEQLLITTPQPGVLQTIMANPGQQITAGEKVANLLEPGQLLFKARVAENQIPQVKVGQLAHIYQGHAQYEGKVAHISPRAENGFVYVNITLPQSVRDKVKPDSSAQTEIVTRTLTNVLFITKPANTKSHTQGDIWVFNQQTQKLHKQNVSWGVSSGQLIQIETQLKAGTHIALNDMTKFKSEQEVLVQ